MKTLGAEIAAEFAKTLGQEIIPLLVLDLPSGTRYISDRSIIVASGVAAGTYDPLLMSWGPSSSDAREAVEARPFRLSLPVVIDNRVRWGGPSTRFSASLIETEPEGAPFTFYLATGPDPTKVEVFLPGKVAGTPVIDSSTVTLELRDWISWKDSEEIVERVEAARYPKARDIVWHPPDRRTHFGRILPLYYGTGVEDIADAWPDHDTLPGFADKEGLQVVSLIDQISARTAFTTDNFLAIARPSAWRSGGGFGYIGIEKFSYTAIGTDSFGAFTGFAGHPLLTGVQRGVHGTTVAQHSIGAHVWPVQDDDLDPSAIAKEDGYTVVRFSSGGADLRKARLNGSQVWPHPTLDDPTTDQRAAHYDAATGSLKLHALLGAGALPGTGLLEQARVILTNDTPNVHDFSDATGIDIGTGGNTGVWLVRGLPGVGHSSLGSPFSDTWDDRYEGLFETDIRERLGSGDGMLVIFRWRAKTVGTRPTVKLQMFMHVHADDHDGSGGHSVKNNVLVDSAFPATWPLPTDTSIKEGVFVGLVAQDLNNKCDATGNFGAAQRSYTRLMVDWMLAVDQSGAGTDWEFEITQIERVLLRAPGWGGFSQETDLLEDEIRGDLDGPVDDASGTYTGTPNAIINNPADVRRHFIEVAGGVPAAIVDSASFVADRAKYAAIDGYLFRGSIESERRFGDVLASMDFAGRAWTMSSGGLIRSFFREDVPTLQAKPADKALTKAVVAGQPGGRAELLDVLPGFPESFRLGVGQIRNILPLEASTGEPTAVDFPTLLAFPTGSFTVRESGDPGITRSASGGDEDTVSAAIFGDRKTVDVPQLVAWIDGDLIVSALATFYLPWSSSPRMVVKRLLVFLDQYELDPGDLVTLSWPVEDGAGFLVPQFDGVVKFLILGPGELAAPGPGLSILSLPLLQVDAL